ncbi:MAG: GNAT family N-acetyltransferase [Verrucomicrobiota bacterium]
MAVHIQEGYRSRGYGTEAMLLAEARRRGFARLGLNVFRGNEVARNLYRSLGYSEAAVIVPK